MDKNNIYKFFISIGSAFWENKHENVENLFSGAGKLEYLSIFLIFFN